MVQKLILPINACRLTATYKSKNYANLFGYRHFGVDMTDKNKKDKNVWASGVGEVLETGWSNSGGNVVVVLYKDCLLTDGTVRNLVIRYYHLAKIICKKGQKTSKDTRLGLYGSTGASTGDHLHIEVDVDDRPQYACYTPQIGRNSGILKTGVDSTINPTKCLYVKASKPDHQSITNSGYDTVDKDGLNYQPYE